MFKKIFDFLVPTVHAAAGNLGSAMDRLGSTGQSAGTLGVSNAGLVLGNIIGFFLSLVGTIFLILTIYGGFMWMTARGDEGQIDKAQKVVQGAVIGLLIVIAAYAITFTLGTRYTASPIDSDGPGGDTVSVEEEI
jgi:cytochrome bd-type quinol oxidase subunit 2